MRYRSITLVAALFGAVTAVPCSDLGWGGDGTMSELFGGLDPLEPSNGLWDIVDARDCWVRWQPIRPDQRPRDARVTKTVFEATAAQIRSTINNYFNAGGTNIQLWLPMATRSLQYSYMLPGNIPEIDSAIDPQSSLSDWQRVVVSIILPSGKRKLNVVNVPNTGDPEIDTNVGRAEEVGITGLSGTIDTGDWAYISGTELRLAMFNILFEQRAAYRSGRPWKKQQLAWTLAEKANGDCVVIDFRNFEEYVLRLPPAGVR